MTRHCQGLLASLASTVQLTDCTILYKYRTWNDIVLILGLRFIFHSAKQGTEYRIPMVDSVVYIAPIVLLLYIGIFTVFTKYFRKTESSTTLYDEKSLSYILSSRAISNNKFWHYALVSTRIISVIWFFSISFCYRIWWYQVIKDGRGAEYFKWYTHWNIMALCEGSMQ